MKARWRAVTAAPRVTEPCYPLGSPTPNTLLLGPRGDGRSVVGWRRSGPPIAIPAAAVDLSVELGRGLVLPNRLVASGTFGYGVEYGDVVDVSVSADLLQGHDPQAPDRQSDARVTETPAACSIRSGSRTPGSTR